MTDVPTTRWTAAAITSRNTGLWPSQMIQTIRFSVPPFEGFDTPEGAMASSRAYNLRNRPLGLSACLGKPVTKVIFGDDFLTLHAAGSALTTAIKDGRPWFGIDIALPASPSTLGEEVFLSGKLYAGHWERGAIARSLEGWSLAHVFLTPNGVFLYPHKGDHISIHVMIDETTMKPFLYWCLGD